MQYRSLSSFERALRKLNPPRAERVKSAIERLVAFFETGDLLPGLGLTQLTRGVWEIRAGIADRVIFYRRSDLVEFAMAGTHDEIRRFLRSHPS